jgi:hypothetical protein
MGECCSSTSYLIAEEEVITILKDPNFHLRNYTYNRLLNEIVSKRIKQEIHKKHIKELLIPNLYTKDSNSNSKNQVYMDSIFDLILSQLKEKNNMYTVMLYFYPFINHEGEKCEENMFSIFQYMAGILSLKNFKEGLTKYVLFVTKGITDAIWQKCDDANIAGGLDDLINNVYNEDNVNRFVERVIADVKKGVPPSQLQTGIKMEQFKELFMKYDLSTIESVRELMLTNGQ